MATFQDNFSKQSDIYLKHRPQYPDELFLFLSSLCAEHQLAWDCGTGNGQAAIGLAKHFAQIIATDPSHNQIKHSIPHQAIQYMVAPAENCSLENHSVDLITCANAMHWFDLNLFYAQVRRVLKPDGIIAAWCYQIPKINAQIDPILTQFHDITLGKYWVHANHLVDAEYTTIDFPFNRIETPAFQSQKNLNLQGLIDYLNTWSATQKYIADIKINPTLALHQELLNVWQNPLEELTLTWKFHLLVGNLQNYL